MNCCKLYKANVTRNYGGIWSGASPNSWGIFRLSRNFRSGLLPPGHGMEKQREKISHANRRSGCGLLHHVPCDTANEMELEELIESNRDNRSTRENATETKWALLLSKCWTRRFFCAHSSLEAITSDINSFLAFDPFSHWSGGGFCAITCPPLDQFAVCLFLRVNLYFLSGN